MKVFKGHKNIIRHDGSTDESWYEYICGHCGAKVSGAVISSTHWESHRNHSHFERWLQCPNCGHGSVACQDDIIPSVLFGPALEGLPENVSKAYFEARSCISARAYTAAELICRKILMHVSVEKGASEGESFVSYLTHLEKQGYVTPPMKGWVDLIRQHGNQSTHKLETPERERAESTVMLTAELLRLVYEMEYLSKKFTKPGDIES